MSVLRLCDMQNRATRSLEPSDIVELWSGFYDKNGTKIYENDIVAYVRNTFYIVNLEIEKEFQVNYGTRLQSIYNNRSNGYKKTIN